MPILLRSPEVINWPWRTSIPYPVTHLTFPTNPTAIPAIFLSPPPRTVSSGLNRNTGATVFRSFRAMRTAVTSTRLSRTRTPKRTAQRVATPPRRKRIIKAKRLSMKWWFNWRGQYWTVRENVFFYASHIYIIVNCLYSSSVLWWLYLVVCLSLSPLMYIFARLSYRIKNKRLC